MAKFTIEIDTDDTNSVVQTYHMLGKLIAMWRQTLDDNKKIPKPVEENKSEAES